jgi:hypothetical protein
MRREKKVGDSEIALKSQLLLVSCIDYRFVVPTARDMEARGSTGNYYHIGVAGASLGSNRYPDFFRGHLELLRNSGVDPEIVIIMDHLGCAAYDKWNNGDDSRAAHVEQLCILARTVRQFYGAGKPVELRIMRNQAGEVDPVFCQ